MKRVFATLRALVEVMEALSKDAAPDGVGRLIVEEVLPCFLPYALIAHLRMKLHLFLLFHSFYFFLSFVLSSCYLVDR